MKNQKSMGLKHKISFAILVFLFLSLLSLPAISRSAEPVVDLVATYTSGPLSGQAVVPGGLELSSNIELTGIFNGDLSSTCSSGYRLYRAAIHAKDGNLNKRTLANASNFEYFSSGEATSATFSYTFNSGPANQKNAYLAIFYCWSSAYPEITLSSSTRQWLSPAFNETTVGGRCNLSNAVWETQGIISAGSEVTMSVNGTLGCNGRDFTFEVWTASFPGVKVATVPAKFPTSGSTPYVVKKTWQVAENKDYYFKARVPDPNGTVITSGTLETGGSPNGDDSVTTSYVFNLENPIGAENFQDLVNIIGQWIFNLAIPIAVIIIIYAGVLMLTAGGNVARFKKGYMALWYAVIGLAVVLIGKGFVTLIQSILNLRNR